MQFSDAQKNMDSAYFGGAPGVLISGLVWITAGLVGVFHSAQFSMLALFFGGMIIHPMSVLMAKKLNRSGAHDTDNPLGKLALESTIILFVGLFLAFYVAKLSLIWFFPIMLLAIGVRYLAFQTLYGNKLYWALGGLLMFAGMLCILLRAQFIYGAFIGGITEVVFAVLLLKQAKAKD